MQLITLLFFYLLTACQTSNTIQTESKPVIKNQFERTDSFAKMALEYCAIKNMNTEFCILVDMSIHSGKYRFYIYDFKKNTISYSCLVGHGCGINPWSKDISKENPTFSNLENSHCSSLGKYKIGIRAYSDWGIHVKYLMHGLEQTNSNALKRFIVFHSWEAVSDTEIYPSGTPEGWGCPTISNSSFQYIDPMLKSSKKPVLMWVYN
jgi:hypothetical protein